jgi:hypothetical protein
VSIRLRLDDLRRAWDAGDPELVGLVIDLASQDEGPPEAPVREGAPTFAAFLAETRGREFRRKPLEEQARRRAELMRALEAPGAEVPLADRLRLHELLSALWEDGSPWARSCLLEIIARVPLVYGPWRALKRIFKEAEARDDLEVFSALAARIDAESAASSRGTAEAATDATLSYLRRRAWRHLRGTARTRPASYADAAAAVLARYDEGTNWRGTWVANQIVYHETGDYNRAGSRSIGRRPIC